MRKIYFDNNATTPVHPQVRKAIEPFLSDQFGNPSSIHWAGRDVRKGIEDARQEIASFFGSQPLEVVFTSSGTESDNLAIKGIVSRVRASRTVSGSTIPYRFTGTYVTRNPCVSRNRHAFITAGCSTCDVMMCFPAFPCR